MEADREMGLDVPLAINTHITRLHDYNDLKDTAQELMGKLAVLAGSTTRAMYEKYELEMED